MPVYGIMVVSNQPRYTAGDGETAKQAKTSRQVADLTAQLEPYRRQDNAAANSIGIGDIARKRETMGNGNMATEMLSGTDAGGISTTASDSGPASGGGSLFVILAIVAAGAYALFG